MPEENTIKIRLSLKGRPMKSYRFNQDVITVGRDASADIYLDNPSISREHVRFERLANGHFSMKDPGSANGVFLNEERVAAAMVYNNDVIRIGKFSLWIEIERDSRGDQPREQRHIVSDPTQQTMMLSTADLERLMSITRATDSVRPPPPTEEAQPARAIESSHANSRQRRVVRLVGIGAVVILATSLGAGFAWLFLR